MLGFSEIDFFKNLYDCLCVTDRIMTIIRIFLLNSPMFPRKSYKIPLCAASFRWGKSSCGAVDLVVVDTVGEVHQEQVAGAAGEALGVPHHALHKLGRRHNQLAGGYLVITVRTMLIVGGILDVGYSTGRKCKTQSVKSFWARSSLGY